MGFIRQSDVIRHNPGEYYIWRPKKIDWIRQWDPGIVSNLNHDASDPSQFQQASLYIFPIYTWFKVNSFLEFSLTPTWQNINFALVPLGLSLEQDDYFYTRFLGRYNTDQSKKWSAGLRYGFGKFYDGKRNTLRFSGSLAPIPHFALTVDYEYNDLENIGHADQNLETHLTSVGVLLGLYPRLQLSSFYQYNSFNEQGRLNIRGSWEYLPLIFVYVVINDNELNSFSPSINEQQVISKVTLIKQF